MVNKYWKKQRSLFFPEITDWYGPKNELRETTKSYYWMLFFNKDMYALIKYSIPITSMFFLGVLPLLVMWYYNYLSLIIIIPLFFLAYFGKLLYTTHVSKEWWYGDNLYDLLLRDYIGKDDILEKEE